MRRVAWMLVLAATSAVALASDAPPPPLPPGAIAAFERGDADQLAALARTLDPTQVRQGLRAGPGATRAAAIAAAPAVPDGWRLLPALALLAGGWDRSTAAGAASSARAIARGLTPAVVEAADLGDDELATAEAQWLALAERDDRWPDLRAAAVIISRAIADARLATGDGATPAWDAASPLAQALDGLRVDDEPAVRRAAIEATPVPAPPALVVPLVRTLHEDADDTVALAAGQALCAALTPTPQDPPAPVLGSVGPSGLARLRALVASTDDALPLAARLDAARCLAASGTRDDEAAVRALARAAPRDVRAVLEAWADVSP